MLNMIRQFTFHKPKEILQPTLWLFLSQACSMLPAILAYMAIYTLGEAFVPPYTLNLSRLVTLAAPVSYTHLDVYKRQGIYRGGRRSRARDLYRESRGEDRSL